jgi:hypothetical protein
MNDCARQFCLLLQFLSAPAEEQIAFCGALIPEAVYDSARRPVENDDRRINLLQAEGQENSLLLLAAQFEEYLAIFFGADENILPEDETILAELNSLLDLMVFYRGNTPSFNRFWGKDALRNGAEWQLVRRLARKALGKLGWPNTLPDATYEEVIHG